MDIWQKLGLPKYVTAPMVDYSELPFRLLTKKYGSQLCYTPMLHSKRFGNESQYRKSSFTTNHQDRPLIVQFCSNNSKDFYAAASYVINDSDYIDLNLGCPQKIAKRGNYGAYLMDDWVLIDDIIKTAMRELNHPVSCKIRIYPNNLPKTLQYCQMLINAGCQLLTIHARGINQKGNLTSLADLNIIKNLKDLIHIPIIANGNVINFDDVQNSLTYTKADAVMSAEAILNNPALFSNKTLHVWDIATEFLDLCQKYPISLNHIRGHLFKIFHLCLPMVPKLRQNLCTAQSIQDFYQFIDDSYLIFSPLIHDPNNDSNLYSLIAEQNFRLKLNLSPYKLEGLQNFSGNRLLTSNYNLLNIPSKNFSPWECHSIPHCYSENII